MQAGNAGRKRRQERQAGKAGRQGVMHCNMGGGQQVGVSGSC
jgi:hypothetical protein